MKDFLFVISGASGSGKTTLIKKLLLDFPDYQVNKSYTTRPPRDNESDYHFVDKLYFKTNNNDFFEIVEYDNNFYGIHKKYLNHKTIFIVDYRGLEKLKEKYKVISFLIYIDLETLRNRLLLRNEINIESRLKIAEKENKYLYLYDNVIENYNLEEAYNKLKSYFEKF